MSRISHSGRCGDGLFECYSRQRDPNCPACRLFDAAPQLLEACKDAMLVIEQLIEEYHLSWPENFGYSLEASRQIHKSAMAAIAEAELKKEAQRGIQLNKTHPLAKDLVGYWLMSETKHTTEPWALQRDGNNQPEYIYSTETKQWICQMNRLSQHCILTTEELCRRETNADFIVRARNSHYLLLEALRQITEGEIKCPCCEGNGQLWADGKAHYPSETRDTILCGNCGGSGRLQPTNAQDIARAAIAEAERNQLLEINKKLMDACKAALTCFREVDRLTWARDIVKQIEAVIGGPKNKGDISGA